MCVLSLKILPAKAAAVSCLLLAVVNSGATLQFGTTNLGVNGSPNAVAVGDFNRDGRLDFASANYSSNAISVRLNNGHGIFLPPTNLSLAAAPWTLASGYFNSDSNLDLVTANAVSATITILLASGPGTFIATTNYSVPATPYALVVGNWNGDSNADLAVACLSGPVSVFLGNADGTFSFSANYSGPASPRGIVSGDFNGDGKSDLATANDSTVNSVTIFLGNGTGTFTIFTNHAAVAANNLAVGYFNNDNQLDLAVQGGSINVLLGNGDGSFSSPASYALAGAQGIAVGDMDADGKIDVITVHSDGKVRILLGDGNGSFAFDSLINVFPMGISPRSPVVLDLNADGSADIAAANSGSTNVGVFFNQVGVTNHPPLLFVPETQIISELSTFVVTNVAVDPDPDLEKITYSLISPPAGASINSTSGVLTWTPTELQGPSTNVLTVRAVDNGIPNLSATNSFTVVVNEVNSPPVLYVPKDFNITAWGATGFLILPRDSDSPTNTLLTELVLGPAGTTFDPTTALTVWIPASTNAPDAVTTNSFVFRTTDNGSPPLTVSNTVRIIFTPVTNLVTSYTVPFDQDYLLFANQFDRNGNYTWDIFPGSHQPIGSTIWKNLGSPDVNHTEVDVFCDCWGGVVLNPGEGGIFYNSGNYYPGKTSLVVTGALHTPVLPVPLTSAARLYSRQQPGVGTFENIIGAPPQDGSVVFRFNKWGNPYILAKPNYLVFTFDNGIWSPSAPVVNVGEAVWILRRPTLTVTQSGTNVNLGFTAALGRTNYVESTDSLIPPIWQPLTSFMGNGNVVTISNSIPSGVLQRHFRVRNDAWEFPPPDPYFLNPPYFNPPPYY